MREISTLTFVSLDGVMQGPSHPDEDKSDDFALGGWASPWWDEAMELVTKYAMSAPYDLLLGRKTYDLFAPHFVERKEEGGTAAILNKARKYVLSNSLENADWQNSTILKGDIPTRVRELKAMDGPPLQVHGSWMLIQSLIENDLIDEFRIWTYPTVVGQGKRLFDCGKSISQLKLTRYDHSPNGVSMGIYRWQKG